MGGLGVGAFVAFTKRTIDAGDALNDLSDRTGVAVKDLASLNLAAKLSDTSLESVGKAVARLNLSFSQAQGGNKEIATSLTRLGVSSTDARERLFQLADVYANSSDKTRVLADLQKVLGKSYADMLPLLKQGGDELRRAAAESESFADAMARLAPEAGKFNDQMDRLKENAATVSAQIVGAMLPALNSLSTEFAEGVKQAGSFSEALRLFGFGLNPFDTYGESLEKLGARFRVIDQQIRRANERRDDDTLFNLEREREDVLKKIKYLTALQNLQKAANEPIRPPGVPSADDGKISFPSSGSSKAGTKVATMQDVLGTGSFFAIDPETIKFIQEQQDAINELNAIVPEAEQRFQSMLAAADFTKLKQDQEDMIILADKFNAGLLTEAEYLDLVKNRLNLVGAEAEKTKSFAEELGLVFESAMQGAIRSGEDFQDVLKGLTAKVVELIAQTYILDRLFKSTKEGGLSTSGSSSGFSFDLGSLFSNGFGNGQNLLGDFASLFGFANGGVMTSAGPLPLARYANGGIANSPQFALFGEGSRPEAFVPLPDGRRIPVHIQGGGQVVNNNTINIKADNPSEVRASRGQIMADISNQMARANRWR